MTDPTSPAAPPPADPTPADEFREGIAHLLSAARRVASQIEPQVNRSVEEAEHALQRLGREGEAAVGEVTREVASFAERIAQKLREAADRKYERGPGEPPAQGG
jgi:DNA anti-recombination protein RmuC